MLVVADVPRAIEVSARIDGCSTVGLFWRVSMPLVTPGIVATGVVCLAFAWNDFTFATTFSGHDTQTIPVAAAQLRATGSAIRRWLVRGLTMSAMGGQQRAT
jgi:multiple sugar transport system permease protein